MERKKILLIEDEVKLARFVELELKYEGYDVTTCHDGRVGMEMITNQEFDMILLDLMLPGLNGEEVLPHIKGIPVIVVSAKVDIDHKVEVLLGGAVDYVTKPFNTKELLARIAVQLRTAAPFFSSTLTFDGLTLDMDTHMVAFETTEIKLTRTEFAILKLLMQNPSQVITKSQILERISENTPDCTENSLKMHISNLRRKLREVSGRDYIEAVWGIGFKL